MSYHLNRIFFLVLFISFSLVSCFSISDLKNEINEEEKLTCLVDGKPFEAVNGHGLFAVDFVRTELVEEETNFLLTVFGGELLDDGAALAVGFRLGGDNLSDLQVGDVFDSWELDENDGAHKGVMGGVEQRPTINSDEHDFRASSNHTGDVSLTITDIDFTNKRISGEFYFTALDDENNVRVEISEGKFENIYWGEE
jgi:hypothetical protein